MTPGISIIIPTYNSAAYITQAIDSVLAQAYTPCQIIVVDDGSTDNTAALLTPYQDKIQCVHQENSGSAAARNRGLQLAEQEYVLFLDADDLMLPNKLRQQAAYLQLHPDTGYVSSGWQQVDETGQILQTVEPWHAAPNLDLDDWLQYKPVQLGAILFRRIWLNRVGGLDPALRQAHDVDLMLRLSLAGCVGAWLYRPTIQYRQHADSTMHRNVAVQVRSVTAVLDKLFARPDLPERLRREQVKSYFYTLLWLGWHAAVNGDEATAVATLAQTMQLAPQLYGLPPENTVVEWLFHFVNWEQENGRITPLPSATWAIFRQAAPEVPQWVELERLGDWWTANQPAEARAAYTPFDLWRIFTSGLDWERSTTELTAELILSWWALVWRPYAQKRYDDAAAGWAHFEHLDQYRLLYLIRMGLAAEPDAVSTNELSLLWRDALAHGLLLESGFDEPALFAALPMVKRPHVSIIVPVFNGARHIEATIESVMAQRYTDWELIVVDDGSTDGTAALLRPYRGQLRLIQQENLGVSAARNKGLHLALGEYVLFLDADDLLRRDKLQQQVAVLQSDPLLGAVHSGWQLVDEDGRPLRPIRPWQQAPELDLPGWLQWKPVFLGAMLFRRSWLLRIEGFRTDLRQAEDTDFLLRLSLAGCPMRWLKRITVDYRQHGAGVTRNGRQQAKDLSTVLDDFFSNPALPQAVQQLAPNIQEYTNIWLVWQLYRTGYEEEMVTYLQRARTADDHPPIILAQTWLVQLATYGRSEGVPVTSLRDLYPHLQAALQLDDAAWRPIERMLEWWLAHWEQLHQGQLGNLYHVQQIVHGAIHLEETGIIRSAVEWVEWWLKVWRAFLPKENCGAGHELAAFADKSATEIVHLAKGSIVYAPYLVETWQILAFWSQVQANGLIRPSEKYQLTSLYLTYFGQALLGRQWSRAGKGLFWALRFSFRPRAWRAWGEFMQMGISYLRTGRVETAV